jgi:DNA-binding CsgD family transcriptional regulator
MSKRIKYSVAGTWSGYDWYRQVAAIIENTDMPRLPDILVQSIRDVVGFEHAVIFGYPSGRRPVFLHNGLSSAHKISSIAPYLNGTYLVDPFYHACVADIEPGLYRMRDLAPDEFYEQVGGHPGYVSPCVSDDPGYLSEEIGYFARNNDGAYIVLSLMRPHDNPPFSSAEFAWLSRVEPVVLSAMSHHWRELGAAGPGNANAACLGDFVEGAFNSFGDLVLTAREGDVARLILRGHSTESIARNLKIAQATVKIHRRNIYTKLNISSQSELFSLFIDLLSLAANNREAGND